MKYSCSLLFVMALFQAGTAVAQQGGDRVLGENWELRSPRGTSQNLNAIAVNGTTSQVAVGEGGAIITSTTLSDWAPAVSGVTTSLSDVIWSPALSNYVAVGEGSTFLTSGTGTTWAKQTGPSPGTDHINAIVAGADSKLLAVGGSLANAGLVFTSTDGLTWSSKSISEATTFKDVVFTGTKYFAVCDGKVFSSADGVAWTYVVLAGTVPTSIAYVASPAPTLVIIGNKSWSSANGTTWTPITPPSADLVINTAGNELVGANAAGEVWSSTDGAQSWQIRLSTQYIQLNAVAKVADRYVVVGESGVVESSSGTVADSLQRQTTPAVVQNLASLASSGSGAVAVGSAGKIFAASAFDTWTTVTPSVAVPGDLTRVIWTGTQYVAVGTAGSIVTSPDGIIWTTQTSASATDKLTGVAWNGTKLLAVGENAAHRGIAISSSDGITWSAITLTINLGTRAIAPPSLLDVTSQGTSFVAIASGYALRSTEGSQWTAYPLAGTVPVRITASDAKVIISGNKSWSSPNGSTWTALTLPAVMVIDRTSAGFTGVTSTGAVWTSTEGASWVLLADAESSCSGLNAATLLADGHHVVVGKNGLIETFKTPLAWDPFSAEANGVAWNGKSKGDALYVAVGWDISWTGTTPVGAGEQGSITWVPHRQKKDDQPWSGVAVIWSGTQFVAVGSHIWTSADGIDWHKKIDGPPPDPGVYTISQMGGRLYAFGYDYARRQVMVAISADNGNNWTPFVDMPGHRWAILSATEVVAKIDTNQVLGYYLAVGWGGRYLTSVTGEPDSWGEGVVPGASTDDFTSVTYSVNADYPVATTVNGAIWTVAITKDYHVQWARSTIWKRNAENTTWVKSANGLASHTLWCVERGKNEFFAAGNYGFILRSFNGLDWREYPPEAKDGAAQIIGSNTPQHINALLHAKDDRGDSLIAVGGVSLFLSSNGALDPPQPTVTFTAATVPVVTPAAINESGSPVTATVTATLTNKLYPGALTVPLVFDHDNKFNTRYKASTTSLAFKAGELEKTFTITATDDSFAQGDDNVYFSSTVKAGDFRADVGSLKLLDDEPGASFDSETSSITEGAPELTTAGAPKSFTTVTVKLASPPTKDVIVPLDYSASTASKTRYTTTAPTSLTIAAGTLSNSFKISAVNDGFADDNSKVVIVKLWDGLLVPKADHVHTVTFTDNDIAGTMATQPASKLVALGSPVTFSASAEGGKVNEVPTGYKGGWKKNGVAVTDQAPASYADGDTSTYFIPSAQFSSAGSYVFQTSEPGILTSSTAQLGVVDTTSRTATVKAGGTVLLYVPAAGNGLTFQWTRNGINLDGKVLNALYVTNESENHAKYVCKVSMPGTEPLDSGDIFVDVVAIKPVVVPPVFGSAAVGADFSFIATASPAASKWTITGLPAGLAYDSGSGLISGRPTRGGSFPVTLVGANAAGTSAAVRATLVVTALPVNGSGTFVCVANGNGAVTSHPGARIDFTIATGGTFTGKLTEKGVVSPFSGTLGGVPGNLRTAAIYLGSKTISITELNTTLGTITGTLTEQGTATPLAVKGWRQMPPTAALSGSYSCTLAGSSQTAGFGYGMVTVGTTGIVTVAGRLADASATSYTLSTFTGTNGQIGLYTPLYANAVGSLLGELDISKGAAPAYTNNSITGTLFWLKAPTVSIPQPTSDSLTTDGGRYFKPAARQMVMGLSVANNNARLVFTGVDVRDDTPDNLAKSPNGLFSVKPVPTNTAVSPSVNPASTILTFTPDKGEFSGQFNDLYGSTVRAADFYGVLIRPAGQTPMIGKGFFRVDASIGSVDLTKAP